MRHWFEDVADHLGSAYLRYSFTKGTDQEVDFLVERLGLAPGARILDVGCGPGRHAHGLGRRGFEVVGVDISERFVALAREATPAGARVTFERADARSLGFDSEFDAVISLCQGAFGLSAGGAGHATTLDPDRDVLAGMARALQPGGRLALSAFSPTLTNWPYGGIVGVHGWQDPSVEGKQISNGCLRMHPADVTKLEQNLPLGTPIQIVN